MPSPRPFAVALALLVACGDSTPPAPVVELTPGADTVSTGYAEIVYGEWLGGERWAVVAPLDVTVGILDLDLGGEGTREVRNPSILFLSADTLYVGDWGLRRVSLWTRDGKLVRAIPAPDLLRGALPQGRDAGGHWYAELKRCREGMAAAIAIPRRSWPRARSSRASTRWPDWRRWTSRR